MEDLVKDMIEGTKLECENVGILKFYEDGLDIVAKEEEIDREEFVKKLKEALQKEGYEIYKTGDIYALDGQFITVNAYTEFIAYDYDLYKLNEIL